MKFDDEPGDGPELVMHEAPRDAVALPRRSSGLLGGLLVLVALVAAVALGFYGRGWLVPGGGTEAVQAATETPRGAAVPAEFGPVPELNASDEFVRALVRTLSQKPEWAAWLASGNLVRTFVVSVDKIAVGSSPAKELKPAAPSGRFQTLGSGAALRIDPQSYDRYNAVANAIDAIDPEAAARAYRRLSPLMQQAFAELEYGNLSFDDRLARALGLLVDTPVPEGDVMLRATSVTFQFADPELEALSPAQKHLLRMGPHNMRLVQTKLRAFARAAGLTQAAGT